MAATYLDAHFPAPAPTPVPLRNNLSWYRGKYYVEPGLNYRSERTTLQLAVPLGSWHISAHDAALALRQRLRPVTAEPNLLLRRELGSHWHARASAELSNRFGDVQQLTGAHLLRDYRTLARNAGPLNRSRRWSGTVGVYYEDPLTSWFYHLTYSHAQTTNSLLYRQRVLASGALLTETLPYVNHLRMHAVAGQASKFITALRTTVTAHVGVSDNQQPQLLNDALVRVRTQTGTATLKAAVAAFSWGNVSYSGSLTGLRSRVATAAAPAPSWLQEHHIGAALFHGSHQLLLNVDYHNSQRARTQVQAYFADATYRYTLPTARKMDLEIGGSNLLNARQYQYAYLSDFTLVQSSYILRPRQLLATWRVSF